MKISQYWNLLSGFIQWQKQHFKRDTIKAVWWKTRLQQFSSLLYLQGFLEARLQFLTEGLKWRQVFEARWPKLAPKSSTASELCNGNNAVSFSTNRRGLKKSCVGPVLWRSHVKQLWVVVDEFRVHSSVEKLGVFQHVQQEGDVCLDSSDSKFFQRKDVTTR